VAIKEGFDRRLMMITIEIGIGGLIIGFLAGLAVSFFAFWMEEKNDGGEFKRGWDAGCEYGRNNSKSDAEPRFDRKEQ